MPHFQSQPVDKLRVYTKKRCSKEKHKYHSVAYFIALINGLLAQDLFCIIYFNLKCGEGVFLSLFSETRFAKIYYIIIDQRISLSNLKNLQNYILLLLQNYILLLLLGEGAKKKPRGNQIFYPLPPDLYIGRSVSRLVGWLVVRSKI